MKVAIIGATSGIAKEVAKIYAARGAALFLVARDGEKLDSVERDLRARGAQQVERYLADLSDLSLHDAIVSAAGSAVDVVLVAHGVLPEQSKVDNDAQAQVEAFELNATSVISLVARFATVMEAQRSGVIAVIGSVAGDRGRRSNYVYGSAKAAVHAYCDGLRSRLSAAGVSLVLIKPGWVDTPMTIRSKKNALYVHPEAIARGIEKAIERRSATVYLPGYWRWISLLVRLLPARLVRF
ncbi:MAG TPA: SDR family NAD(P)-dependent oxidoreductase [Thermoanaerobaculia bacterium]